MNIMGKINFDKDRVEWDISDDSQTIYEGNADWLLFAEEKVGQVLVFPTPAGYKRVTITIEDASLENSD